MEPSFLYVGDPMCSWCWGFAPELRILSQRYEMAVQVVVGGLRPGPDAQPLDERLRAYLAGEWEKIERMTGQPFDRSPLDWQGWVYDTELPARAVVVARRRRAEAGFDLFERLQRAFYAEGVDVTRADVYPGLVQEVGLEAEEFLAELTGEGSREAAWDDFRTARRLGVTGFPTLLLVVDGTGYLLTRGYRPAEHLVPLVEQVMTGDIAAAD